MTHAMAHKDESAALFGVAAMAALLGATTALLFAPRSGKDTRDGLIRKMHEAQLKSKQKVSEMKRSAADTTDTVRDKANEMKDAAQDMAAETQDAAATARNRIDDAASDPSTRVRNRRTPS